MWLRKCLAAFFILAALCSASWAARLVWDANTETDLAGYKIHYGLASGQYTNTVDVGNVTEWQIPESWPRDQSYYFAATAYNTAALESVYSNEVVYYADLPPAQATDVEVTYRENSPMAIAFDNKTTEVRTAGGEDPLSISHTVGAGSNMVLYAALLVDCGTASLLSSTATYDGSAMDLVGTVDAGAGSQYLVVYRKIGPSAGAHTIELDYSPLQSASPRTLEAAGYVVTYSGVHQTTPNGDPVYDSGSGTDLSSDVTSESGDMVIDFVGVNGNPDIAEGANQTKREEVNAPQEGNAAAGTMLGASEEAGATTVTMSWSWTGSQRSSQIAFNLNAAVAGQTLDGVRKAMHKEMALRPVLSMVATALVRKTVHKDKSERPVLSKASTIEGRKSIHKGYTTKSNSIRGTSIVSQKSFHREKSVVPFPSSAAGLVTRKAVHREKSDRPALSGNIGVQARRAIHLEKSDRPLLSGNIGVQARRSLHRSKASNIDFFRNVGLLSRTSFHHEKSDVFSVVRSRLISSSSAYHRELSNRPFNRADYGVLARSNYHKEKVDAINLFASMLLRAVKSPYHHEKSGHFDLSTEGQEFLVVINAIHRALSDVLRTAANIGIAPRHAFHDDVSRISNLFGNIGIAARKAYHHEVSDRPAEVANRGIVVGTAFHEGMVDRNTLRALYSLTGIRPAYVRSKSGVLELVIPEAGTLVVANAIHHAIARLLSLNAAFSLNPRHAFHDELASSIIRPDYRIGARTGFHKEKADGSAVIRNAILSVANSIHESFSGRPAPSRSCILTVQKAIHDVLSGKINFAGAAQLLIADAIHRQLAGKAVIVESDRFALLNFIARNQEFSIMAKSSDFNFTARPQSEYFKATEGMGNG